MPITYADRKTSLIRTAANAMSEGGEKVTSKTTIELGASDAETLFKKAMHGGLDAREKSGIVNDIFSHKGESAWVRPGVEDSRQDSEGFNATESVNVSVKRTPAFRARLQMLLEEKVGDEFGDLKKDHIQASRSADREFACPPSATQLRATWNNANDNPLSKPSDAQLRSAYDRGDSVGQVKP